MSESPNVVKLVEVAADAEQQDRENVNAFLEHCKEQRFESIVILGLRDGILYATQCGIESKIETLGMLHMAADAFLRN
jgi:hypothetical protein